MGEKFFDVEGVEVEESVLVFMLFVLGFVRYCVCDSVLLVFGFGCWVGSGFVGMLVLFVV